MAIRLRIALVICLVLFILMEDVNPFQFKKGGGKYKKLAARVKKLEDVIFGADLDCELCTLIKNLTALVEKIVDEIHPPTTMPPIPTTPETTTPIPTTPETTTPIPTTPKGPCTAIGVEDQYKVSDSQMTASSVYLQYYAYRGRLNGATGWCQSSQQITNYDYLQIDMRRLRYVCAVSTQGKKNGSWVTSYKLKFSIDGVTFYTYQENNMDKIFQANSDLNTIVHHSLSHDVEARYIRFYPVTRYNFPCMRVEVFAR